MSYPSVKRWDEYNGIQIAIYLVMVGFYTGAF